MPAATKKKRAGPADGAAEAIVARRQQARVGERARLVVDGPSPEHELVLRGRLAGQAPDIDPMVYLTDCDPPTCAPGRFIDVEIVGARGYDLVGPARSPPTLRPEAR